MSNISEVLEVLENLKSDINTEVTRLEKLLEEYSIATSGIVIVEKVIANLSEIANGEPKCRGCKCEHLAHTKNGVNTPNGNPGHLYDAVFYPRHLVKVKTPFGTFEVCNDCAADCYAEYPRVEK